MDWRLSPSVSTIAVVSTSARAVRHAGRRYRSVFRVLLRPVGAVEAEVQHLHDVEQAGESAETPLIAMLGLALFLWSLLLLVAGIALAVYYFA